MAHPTRIFKEPKDLQKVWEEYKDNIEVQQLKWQKIQYVGKEGNRVTDPVKIPYTFEGLKRYCWDNEIGCIEQYFTNQDNCYKDFMGICSRIKNEIRENQIIGGMNGFFNPSITQRLNGLSDKLDHTSNGASLSNNPPTINVYNTAPPMASSEEDIETNRE
jgi:hypothetical protein